MDLYCTRCGEPWDTDTVLHDAEPGEFDRVGNTGKITMCPACRGTSDEELSKLLSDDEKGRNYTRSAMADLLGDDIDGLASTYEDMGDSF